MTVTASGTATTPATRGRIELRASGEGADAATARNRAADHEARLRDALASVGIDDAIRTTEFSLDDPTERFDADGSDDYRAVESLAVDVAVGDVRDVLVAATDAGATVRGVDVGVSEAGRERLHSDAVSAAMASARTKAEAAAAGMDGELDGVCSVAVERDDRFESIVEEAVGWTGGAEFQPDPASVTATVEVCYALAGTD